MTENSRRDRVGLGLIGLGPSWEQIYRDTLGRLQNRLKVRLVYDPVEGRARSVAAELGAEVASSLRQIVFRQNLQGLLVLDPGWCSTGILALVAHSSKPIYLARPVLRDAAALHEVLESPPKCPGNHQLTRDDQLMPELGLRFTPASCRLRELIATKLGKSQTITLDCDLNCGLEEVAILIDWCNYIMGHAVEISAKATRTDRALTQIDLAFSTTDTSHSSMPAEPRTATLRHMASPCEDVRIEVVCESGQAFIPNRTHIQWRTAAESAAESLADERTEFDILIDQFCRRALGGLNPIGRLSELVSAIDVVKTIW